MADSASLDSIHPATPVNQGGGLLSMQQVLDEGPATITVTEVEAQASENPDDTRGPEWMYSKGPRIFGNIWYYASTQVQVALISIICFLEPGLFNAITGLGGAGQIDATAADNANTALYSSFCVFAFLVGPFVNRFGFKWTVFVGTLGYAIYVASFLCYNFTRNDGFVIFGGTNLGACAAILWVAQGGMLTSYPHEEEKGRYVSWFWGVFSLGSFLGALASRAILSSSHRATLTSSTDSSRGQSSCHGKRASQNFNIHHYLDSHGTGFSHCLVGYLQCRQGSPTRWERHHSHPAPDADFRVQGYVDDTVCQTMDIASLSNVHRLELVLYLPV
jgi:hypothetical protein